MVSSNDAGIQKVIDDSGKYAFFMESASIEYIVERKCKVTQIGGLLDDKVKLKKGSMMISLNLRYWIFISVISISNKWFILLSYRVMGLQWLIIHLTNNTLIRQYLNYKNKEICIKWKRLGGKGKGEEVGKRYRNHFNIL